MQIIENTLDFQLDQKSAIAIGKFDGIHIGHQKLIEEVMKQKEYGMQTVIFTFDPSPQILFGYGDQKQLMTKEEKRRKFSQMGIDVLFEFPLTRETAAIAPLDFIKEILVGKMCAGMIVAGTDLSFGDKGKGDCTLLEKKGRELGYQTLILDKVCVADQVVSSTLIRTKIEAGEMEAATTFLGNPYEINGIVTTGKQLGRTISFPTCNLIPEQDKLLPPSGVYCSEICVGEQIYYGITNVGIRPTVSDSKQVSIETYLFDFSGDLYGHNITVRLLHHTRPEVKFDSVDDLKMQLERDKRDGKAFFHLV